MSRARVIFRCALPNGDVETIMESPKNTVEALKALILFCLFYTIRPLLCKSGDRRGCPFAACMCMCVQGRGEGGGPFACVALCGCSF
jgi:hypothetical protein